MKRTGKPTSKKPRKRSPTRARQPKRGSAEAILQFAGCWHGPPGELDALLAEVQAMRDAEVNGAVRHK